ncbi:MAG: hypothetical protein WBG62_10555, partial [Cyclobacteriaceae bacterium]
NELQQKYAGRRTRMQNLMVSASNVNSPEVHDLLISRMDAIGNPEGELPQRITLVRPSTRNPQDDTLYLDKVPLPRKAWHYDRHDRTLRWQGAFGGGQIHIDHKGRGAVGMIGPESAAVSVSAGSRTQMICDVAENVGATYESSGQSIVGFKWDPNSAAWKNAAWVAKRLLLTYTVKQSNPLEPPSFTFEFEDKQTGSIPWDPTPGAFEGSLKLGRNGNAMDWDLVFKSTIAPPADMPINPPEGPKTVFPYWMQAKEDAAVSSINGVLQVEEMVPNGKILGFQGVRATSNIATGYYSVSPKKAPFALFDGKIHIDGKPVGDSHVTETSIHFSGLDHDHQEKTGLPASGQFTFTQNGSKAKLEDSRLRARRLSGDDAHEHISANRDTHPQVHAMLMANSDMLAADALTIYGLLPLTPFGQNSQAQWTDVVQEEVRGDLTDIMNSYIPDDMWNLIFPNVSRSPLSSEVAAIASSQVNGKDPGEWYRSLSTAVLTQGMANTSDEYTKFMNGPRAAAWLKEEVANSAVYEAHGQKLFQLIWNKKNSTTTDYLGDQVTNAATYNPVITQQVNASVQDIQQNVTVDSSSPTDLKQKLIGDVRDAGQYAIDNKLYWAFYYYTYNTAPAILTNIAVQMGLNTGSSDGTTLSRLFQQNIAVLTALDPSGFYARQYNKTINVFLATNILPSMYGFVGDASHFSLIKEYLQTLISQNLNSEDQQIAQAAANLQNLLAQQGADEMLKNSIDALRAFSETLQDTLALPYVAQKFLSWFKSSYPRSAMVGELFGSVLIGGLASMAVFNLFTEYKNWDKLTGAQKTEVILNTVQLGIQILAAVVKRGVRIYAIFNVSGMSGGERFAAVSRITLSGEADRLNEGMIKVGNKTAKWLGDVANAEKVPDEAIPLLSAVDGITEEATAELTLTAKVFGRNLDEFIATRIGPVFILAGMALSIYFIATGESGLSLASDIINLVGGSLMIFSIVGGWLVEAGIIAAEGALATIIAVAGPLAILAALVGLGLMLYMMFKKQPDPVEDFLNKYVKPRFYVADQFGSIDYVMAYPNTASNNLMMLGFRLSNSGKYLSCNTNGIISLTAGDYLPDCVWKVGTDGNGLSRIGTLALRDGTDGPVGMFLSLMSDNTISFQPKMTEKKSPADNGLENGAATVQTQTWKASQGSDVKASADGKHLKSLSLNLQPVIPDSDGKYNPDNATGYLALGNNNVAYSPTNVNSQFSLEMEGIAPNYMSMRDLTFLQNTAPSQAEKFSPMYGVPPSTPLSFSLTGALPDFLAFDDKEGSISPNGKEASTVSDSQFSLTATNSLGHNDASFGIEVEAPKLSAPVTVNLVGHVPEPAVA